MSSTTRTSNRGSKNKHQNNTENHNNTDSVKSAGNENTTSNKSAHNKNDSKAQKNNSNTGSSASAGKQPQASAKAAQPTAEQLRIARLIKDQSDDPDLNKIKAVMDATKKSEEAVCAALAECDDDVERAVEVLLEGDDYEFTSVKKKKNKTAPGTKGEAAKDKSGAEDDPNSYANNSNFGERRGRGRGRGAPADRGGRPYRSRENKENERSQDNNNDKFGEFSSGGDRRRGAGSRGMSNGPGRFGARGGRGGGRAGPRTYSSRQDRVDSFPKSIDTWNNPGTEEVPAASTGKMETWGEFPSPEDWDNEEYTGSLADSKVFTSSAATDAVVEDTSAVVTDHLNTSFNSNEVSPGVDNGVTDELRPTSPVGMSSATLTAAQSQYLSQLTQQAQSQVPVVDKQQQPQQLTSSVYGASSVQPSYATVSSPSTNVNYTTGTEFVNSYVNDIGGSQQQVMPQRNKAPRTRVPPPSKIPASAVEMPPGDASVSSGIGTIDVQFGALDFGTEPPTSFESSTETAVQTLPSKYVPTDPIISEQQHSYVNTSLAAAASQLKTNHASLTSSLTKNSESLLNNESSYASSGARGSTFQELAKSISAGQDVHLHSSAPYDTPSFPQPSSGSLYKTPASVSSYTPAVTSYAASNVYSGSNYSNGGSYNSSSQYAASSYVPSYPASGYGAQNYPSSVTQSYPYNNVSGLGASSGYNSYQTNYTTSSASNPLSHKLSTASASLNKDSQYESIPPSGAGTPATSALNSSPAGLSSLTTQTSISSTKPASAAAAAAASSNNNPSSSSSVSKSNVANIPPGVAAPIVGTQYIMSQTGLPYMYNQPPLYNFDDLQMLPNRIPTHYYDINSINSFPPTSMGTRDATGLASVAYSAMSDGRFARTDNNASPVPSSLSTQNATQAPLLNPPIAPTYAYYYSSPFASNQFSYSTPLYPPVNTGGYASAQQPTKTSGTSQGVGGPSQTPSSASTDLSGNMYSKTHASLTKVNSYEKQAFHTGTPPPYNLPGVTNAVSGMGPTGGFSGQHTYQPVIVPSGPPHHSTTLMHQPHLQDSSGNSTSRSQTGGSQVNKPSSKQYYNWTQN